MFRPIILTVLICSSFATSTLCQDIDTASYSLGLNMGMRLKAQGAHELDYQSLILGIQHVLTSQQWLLTRTESDSINYQYFENQRILMHQRTKEEGENFLATNAERPEVEQTESGLQYEIIKAGEGIKPSPTSTVTVHYTGTFIDGQKFDSSIDYGSTASFRVDQVISGWTEGLQLMSVGSKFKFYIPFQLGYGSRGYGRDIPPYSVLIFEVELFDVK